MIQIFKTNQEQAIAAWINHLNQLRINELLQKLHQQDINYDEAIQELKWALDEVHKTVRSNRGGECGIHGFLAEIAEKGIYNAKRLIDGLPADMEWLNDDGAADLRRAGVEIQQKFYESDGLFSLGAVEKHLQKYPDFLKNGGKYQIPKDQYESVAQLYRLSEKEAYRQLSNRSDDGLTIRQWRKIHNFFDHSYVKFEDLEPAEIQYHEAQEEAIDNTLQNAKADIKERSAERRQEAYKQSKPTIQEGLKATAAAAAIEGGTALLLAIIGKIRLGKNLFEFTEADWTEILDDAGIGTVTGGVRGASIYLLTNYTATPAAIASSLVTASFGVAEQIKLYRSGKLSELELLENSQIVCLEASVSALSSFVGQVVIPVPVLGAVIGNTIGSVLYRAMKDGFYEQERQLFETYFCAQVKLDKSLQEKCETYLSELRSEMNLYIELLEHAFVTDVYAAFNGSVTMAMRFGVPSEEILDRIEKIDAYFL